jgi:hypothetical protein
MIKDKLQKLFTKNRTTVNYCDSINVINVRGKYKDNITLRKLIEHICNKNHVDSLFDSNMIVIEINFNKIDQSDYDKPIKDFPLLKGILRIHVGLETFKERMKRRRTDEHTSSNYASYINSAYDDLVNAVKVTTSKPVTLYQRKCVNCGAPLSGHKCKFCDTEYYEM